VTHAPSDAIKFAGGMLPKWVVDATST